MKKGIKARWLASIFLLTAVVLFIFSCLIVYLFSSRYYHAVEMTLYAGNSDVVYNYFENFSTASQDEFESAASKFTTAYRRRDIMDVWVIDKNGKVVSSSGDYEISADEEMADYYSALRSDDALGISRGKMSWGEPIMAMSSILKDRNQKSFGAVRYIISIEDVNNQLFLVAVFVFLGYFMVVLLIANSGVYFVSSIIAPVNKINRTAKRIASGDFSVRIESQKNNDELDELCKTINDMASQLDQTEKMKNEFISTVSHEIRTPLTAISGWAETLAETGESDIDLMKKGISVISGETQRLSGMVEELLDFSRITGGEAKRKAEMTDVVMLAERAVLVYNQKATNERKNLSLKYDKRRKYYIYADADRIFRVFVNILDNAVKYTEENGNIIIKVEKFKNYVRILFNDDGCGISEKDLPFVKKKFYKANSTVRGTGIGLAVADEIVNAHGGKLNITSTFGKGTSIEVLLPLRNKEEL